MSFLIVAAVYCNKCKPYVVVSTIGTSSLKYPLNIYGVTFNLKISFIYGGLISHSYFYIFTPCIDNKKTFSPERYISVLTPNKKLTSLLQWCDADILTNQVIWPYNVSLDITASLTTGSGESSFLSYTEQCFGKAFAYPTYLFPFLLQIIHGCIEVDPQTHQGHICHLGWSV